MKSVLTRSQAYFDSEFQINISDRTYSEESMESISLLDTTAAMCTGGTINLFVLFSFDKALLNQIYNKMTDDIAIDDDEIEFYRQATAKDVINTVMGHCTIDWQSIDHLGVVLEPPIILDDIKKVRRLEQSIFYTTSIQTLFGKMVISLAGFPDLMQQLRERT